MWARLRPGAGARCHGAVLDDLADLLTGSHCLGCAAPGRLLCTGCRAGLPVGAVPAWPTPCPAGLAPPWAAGAYEGLLRAMVLAHKEHGLLALAEPLGLLLAQAVEAALRDALPASATATLLLVPVPSRRASVRARGHDATYAMTARAARHLTVRGYDALPHRLLAIRGPLLDQAGLSREQRAVNLAGSLWVPTARLAALRRRRSHGRVVVCDDVLTTGATGLEAQRAVEAVGLEALAVAAVAATRRRGPDLHSESSGGAMALRQATD